jgi:hypothetical protein
MSLSLELSSVTIKSGTTDEILPSFVLCACEKADLPSARLAFG